MPITVRGELPQTAVEYVRDHIANAPLSRDRRTLPHVLRKRPQQPDQLSMQRREQRRDVDSRHRVNGHAGAFWCIEV
jgi:hypothetical protein